MAIAAALSMAVAACGNSAIAAKADSASSETPVPAASTSSDTDSTSSGDVTAVVTPEPESDVLLGGWEINKGKLVPDSNSDAVKAFNSALEGITGCDYDLIAVLGSQSVAGTNYSYLCRETTVAPDAESKFAIVNIYEDLNGNAMLFGEKALPLMEAEAASTEDDTAQAADDAVQTVTNASSTEDNAVKTGSDAVPAGNAAPTGSDTAKTEDTAKPEDDAAPAWQYNQDKTDLSAHKDVQTAFEQVTVSTTNYEPVAYIGSRETADGTEYAVFCSKMDQKVVKNFCMLSIRVGSDGSAEITGKENVDLSAM